MNNYQVVETFDDVARRVEGQFGEWTEDRNTVAQLDALRQRAKTRAEGAMGDIVCATGQTRNQVNGRAKDAWGRFAEAVRLRKEEAERLHDAQQLNDGGDLDPVVQSGSWFDEIHSSYR
jgi:uncharacterized protein YjbJ (UPF0337 family)